MAKSPAYLRKINDQLVRKLEMAHKYASSHSDSMVCFSCNKTKWDKHVIYQQRTLSLVLVSWMIAHCWLI